MDNFPSQFKTATPSSNPRRCKIWLFILLAILIAGGFFVWRHKSKKTIPISINNQTAETQAESLPQFNENVVSHTICEGDIPAEVFAEYGKLDANDTANLLDAAKDVYDFTNIKIGQNLDFVFCEDGEKIEKIRYYPDSENMIVAEADGKNFKVKKENIPYAVSEETLNVEIDEFLYKDAIDAGLSEASILEAADVFSFDIDFNTEIQAGDKMKVIYEKRTLQGKPAPNGKIIAAKFVNSGQEYFAYSFESNGKFGHYDAEGHELMRQFLRAPLSYRRISSGYTSARINPITRTISAHYQIDYAAPSGTPVVTTANGTVVSAGWEGGWGNMVRIKHENGFTTHYGHLSAYGKGIKSGTAVSQGQVVGYVGSTGWSTGPHLDYGIKLNSSPVNPLSLKLPKGNPLSGAEMEKFQELKRKYDELLK
ncbi:MAG TPA: peptidoglycan DD-metalloendopeptidase family protein [Candidatus Moranbacteria bacterium]|nr:peptidoglycan DD-metalloendopeptidase family protein [Candidatus Moranbacteria bacterium]